MIFTFSEIEAYKLVGPKIRSTDMPLTAIRDAADSIILLAEKIKAERLTAAMNT